MVAISAPCRARLGRGAPRLELSALLWPASILLSSWPPNVYHHIVMSPSLSASERTVQDPDVGNASLYYGRVVRVRLCPNWPAKLNVKLNVFTLFCIACLREFAPLPKGRASQNPGSAAARPHQPPFPRRKWPTRVPHISQQLCLAQGLFRRCHGGCNNCIPLRAFTSF